MSSARQLLRLLQSAAICALESEPRAKLTGMAANPNGVDIAKAEITASEFGPSRQKSYTVKAGENNLGTTR